MSQRKCGHVAGIARNKQVRCRSGGAKRREDCVLEKHDSTEVACLDDIVVEVGVLKTGKKSQEIGKER